MISSDEQAVRGYLRGKVVGSGIGQRLGVVELHVQRQLAKSLRPGQTFWDIGGYEGYFSLLGSALVGDAGRVITFEPSPRNATEIRRFLGANRIRNCTLIEKAMASERGTATLYLPRASTQASLLAREGEAVEIETTTVDHEVAKHGAPDVIKLDVEGLEVSVLQGGSSLLRQSGPRTWVIEAHSTELAKSVRELLEDANYRVREIPLVGKNRRPSEVVHWHAHKD